MTLHRPEFVPVLPADQAAHLVERVHSLRDSWTPYSPTQSIFRLGATSNARPPRGQVHGRGAPNQAPARAALRRAARERAPLARSPLQAVHNAPVVFEERFSLPGFHVFLVNEKNENPLALHGGFHCDMATFGLDWQPALPDKMPLEHCVSFTLPLALPPAGGGLLVCEQVSSREVLKYVIQNKCDPQVAMNHLASQHQPVLHPYEIGRMIVHSGQIMHAMSPWKWAPGDARITLQGHGFLLDGRWRLFWLVLAHPVFSR